MNSFQRHPRYPKDDHRRPAGAPHKPPAPFSSAPAVRVQNLKRLEAVCGPELLAIKLGIPLGRLREMLEGVNFSSEMAFHIEATLGVTSGFMDKPGAPLSEEDKVRLKQPASEEVFDELPPRSSPARTPTSSPVQAVTPGAASNPQGPAQGLPASTTHANADAPALKETPMNATATLSAAPVLDEAALREVRTANFKLLTSRKGVKSRLVELTGLSPANISHRLHGHKIFDKDTGEFFCMKLGLPSGWFEAPRTEADIPEKVMQLLTGAIPGAPAPVAAQPRTVSKTALPKPAGVPLAKTKAQKAAGRKAPSVGTVATIPGLALSSAARGAGAAPASAAPVSAPATPAPSVATVPTPIRRRAAPAASSAQSGGVAVLPPAAPVATVAPTAPAAPAGVAGPLAQAALAVLTLKVQSGRLSEERAMQMLGEFAQL